MFAWIKIFKDGTKEIGTDEAIENKEASWSRGRLSDITEVHLYDKAVISILSIPNTEWNQKDRYIVYPEECATKRVARFVQAKVTKEHVGLFLKKTNQNNQLITFFLDVSGDVLITEDMIGDWITLACFEYKTPYVFFSPYRNKGKV